MMQLPHHMHAVVLTGHGGLDRLEYRTNVRVPQPKADEVLIEVAACGINNTDINTRTGWYASKIKTGLTKDIGLNGAPAMIGVESPRFPRIQGADAVGRIVAVGVSVAKSRLGDRVLVDPCIRDTRLPPTAQGVGYFGTDRDGGFAQYAIIPSQNALTIKSNLDDVSLASFACSYSTAEEMLVRTRLQSGETILVTGASGGVGTANIQLAKLRGARVIAVASMEKGEHIRSLGADFFISRQTPDLFRAVIELVGKNAIDVVADVTGGPTTASLLRVLRRAGRYTTAGAIAGPVAEIDLRQIVYKDLEMYGVTNPQAETFTRLVQYIEDEQLKPLVSQSFPLKDLAQAQRLFIEKSHVGKFVIRMKD
jgi:NADPH:quinone reductase-like Zn-dependent oxidoreductase